MKVEVVRDAMANIVRVTKVTIVDEGANLGSFVTIVDDKLISACL